MVRLGLADGIGREIQGLWGLLNYADNTGMGVEYSLPQIRDAIVRGFDEREFKEFCFDYFSQAISAIPQSETLRHKAMELVSWCHSRDRTDELIDAIKKERPNAFEPPSQKKDTLPRRAQFFGRTKEIEQVLRALDPHDRSWGIVIDGIGGIGKTALAVECAHRALEAGTYASAVFITAKTNRLVSGEIKEEHPTARTIDEFVNEAARAIGREGIAQESGEAKRRALLAALRGEKTLLIFDNLETLNKAEDEAMGDWLRDLPGGCKAMLTSRRRGGEGAVWLRLDKLEDSAALEIIKAEMDKDAGLAAKFNRARPERWQALVDEAGGSPLALTSVLGILRKRHTLSVEGAIELLRKKDADADLLKFVFQEAKKDLTDNDVTALRALSFFAPSASFEAWAETAELSREALTNTIDRLNTLSLLNVNAGEDRYALHPLTRGFARADLLADGAVRRTAALRFARYWVEYAERFGGQDKDSYKTFPKLEAEWDNLSAAEEVIWEWCDSERSDRVPTSWAERSGHLNPDREFARLLMGHARALRQFLWFGGRWEERILLASRQYAATLGMEDWSNAGWGARDMAWMYYNRAETDEAQTWAEKCQQAWNKCTKDDQAEAERMLGLVAEQRKDYATAQQKYEAALAMYRDIGAKQDEGSVLNDLGGLAHAREDYATAEGHFRAALEIARKTENVEMQAGCFGNLGSLALDKKDYPAARGWVEQALPLAQRVGRQDLIGSDKYRLARVCEAEGNRAEALALAREAVAIFERLKYQDLPSARAFLQKLEA